ncbi:MAG: hypothetical protein ACO4CZ_05620 [Planctomycetota bacterium]|jgi:hypothetical protein
MTSKPQTNAPQPCSTATAKRQCPTLRGEAFALITHRIGTDLCMKRQREHYHKCHRCEYRGQPASFVAEERIELMPTAETGLPPMPVDLPSLREKEGTA